MDDTVSKTEATIIASVVLLLLILSLLVPWVKGHYAQQQRHAVERAHHQEQRAAQDLQDQADLAKFCQTYWLWEDKTGQREPKMVDLCHSIPGGGR